MQKPFPFQSSKAKYTHTFVSQFPPSRLLTLNQLTCTWSRISTIHPVYIYRNAHSNGSHATREKARYRDFLDPPFPPLSCLPLSNALSLSLPLSPSYHDLFPFSFNYTAKVMIDMRVIELAQWPRSIPYPSLYVHVIVVLHTLK